MLLSCSVQLINHRNLCHAFHAKKELWRDWIADCERGARKRKK